MCVRLYAFPPFLFRLSSFYSPCLCCSRSNIFILFHSFRLIFNDKKSPFYPTNATSRGEMKQPMTELVRLFFFVGWFRTWSFLRSCVCSQCPRNRNSTRRYTLLVARSEASALLILYSMYIPRVYIYSVCTAYIRVESRCRNDNKFSIPYVKWPFWHQERGISRGIRVGLDLVPSRIGSSKCPLQNKVLGFNTFFDP